MTNPFSRRNQQPAFTPAPTIAGGPIAALDRKAEGSALVPPALPATPPPPDIENLDLPMIPAMAALDISAPRPSPSPEMPDMSAAAVRAAGMQARQKISTREGRASTLLTTPDAQRQRRTPRPTLAGATSPYARVTRG